jgi:hypothetical protein
MSFHFVDKKSNKNLLKNYFKIKHSYSFTSLIAINSLKFVSAINQTPNSNVYKKFTKIKLYIKQSYMLLTWLTYSKSSKSSAFIFRKKVKRLTLTKSPMAHKTFSQEQFKWESTNTVISQELITDSNTCGLNTSLKSINNDRKLFNKNPLGTNVFFLNKVKSRYVFLEKNYLSLI